MSSSDPGRSRLETHRLQAMQQCTVPQCFQNNHVSFVSFIWLIALVILVYPPKWRQQCLADSGRFGRFWQQKKIYGCIALKSMKSRARLPDLFENGKSLDIWKMVKFNPGAHPVWFLRGLHPAAFRDWPWGMTNLWQQAWRMIRGRLYVPSFHSRHSKKQFGIQLGTARSQTM